ncbi:MAG: BrxA/BrxB family bacilliredoxin, partial [Planctomycetota bacterium]
MPYDPMLVQPMRDELREMGVRELTTPQEVDEFLARKEGTTLLFVNSVCGCAAGSARPALRLALENGPVPD